MNDVPVSVAWIIALALAVVVAVCWRALRRLPQPTTSRWHWRVVGWIASAATLGPLIVVTIWVLGGTLLRWRTLLADPGQTLARATAGIVYIGGIAVLVSVLFFMLPYAPVLFLWARLGPHLGRLEASRAGIALSAGLLAIPGTLASVAAYGLLDAPFGYAGTELLKFGGTIFVMVTISLLVPRLSIPGIRAGVFAGTGAG